MKKVKNKILHYIIKKAKKSKFLQSAVESPITVSSFSLKGHFNDSSGTTHALYNGLRNTVKPGASTAAEKMKKEKSYSDEELGKMARDSKLIVEKLLSYLNVFGTNIKSSDVLEIGCHSGVVSYALSDLGAKVTGSEFSGYKVESTRMNEVTKSTLVMADESLQVLRKRVSKHFNNTENVTFVDDDICNSVLPSESFDIIVSWDVLEHLSDPEKAFQNISRLLKKDGISINEYNPFFSLNGGHSLCTLDFFWGHARLNESDFLRYINQERPEEADQAKSFYLKGLNRMTIESLKAHIEKAGLTMLACFQFTREQHIRMLNSQILLECKRNYNDVTATDLVTPKIIVAVQKK